MGEAKVGEAFITHEFDEAIAIQQAIVDAEKKLAGEHPEAAAKKAIQACLKDDQQYLKELQQLGKPHGATGKAEDVASALKELMEETTQKATEEGAESDAYEAHAVLVNLKRKQQDSAAAMVKIAREMKDTKLRDAAVEFEKGQKTGAQELADQLAAFAVKIATQTPAA
jgi:hypothetical protein